VFLVVGRDVAEPARRFAIRRGRWDDLRAALASVAYDGATNLTALTAPPDCDLALLFSDGLGNWGAAARAAQSVPLYALSAAASIDARRLSAMAQASGGEWIDLTAESAAAVSRSLQVRKARLLQMQGEGLHSLVSTSPYPDGDRLTVAGIITAAR